MIVVGGEALIDLFVRPGDGTVVDARPGGSPFNVAVGLARLGVATGFLGGVSTDHFGDLLLRTAAAEGVNVESVKRSSRPTPLVAVAPDAAGQPTYSFYAHDTADRDLNGGDLPATLSGVAAIALGSYALAVEPIGATLLALAAREGRRRVISLDPNLRPTLVGPIAAWRARFEAVAAHATIVKLSEEDFAGGWGGLAEADNVAARWLGGGVHLAALTRGASGATFWWQGGQVTLPGYVVTVVDTVGAGDSFQAALLARLADRGLLDQDALMTIDRAAVVDAAGYAMAAAALTCSRRGADLPRRAEVEAFRVG